MFAPNRLAQLCCCCCGGPKGIVSGTVLTAAIPPFSSAETAELLKMARNFIRDPGRRCADFFATLLTGEDPDLILAARFAILLKLRGLDPGDLTSANSTLCARLPDPTTAPLEPPPFVREPQPPTSGCPFIVQSRRGPQVFRSTRGFGCHDSLASAVQGMQLVIRNNPGLSARVTNTLTGTVEERINE